MSIFLLILSILGMVLSFFAAYVVFHVVRWLLSNVSSWRVKKGKKPFSDGLILLLSIASALSLLV